MTEHDYWSFFAEEARRLNAPLYTRLAKGIGEDAELRALAETARPGQPLANILLGAVHFLLLRGVEHPLRSFYPNLNGGRRADETADPVPVFMDFVESHRSSLASLVASRITNTNEVGRSAVLHAGFRALAAAAPEPLNLVEIGPSAGLNLVWDRYRIRYMGASSVYLTDAPEGSLVIESGLRGDKVPPLGPPPRVASRIGLERNPVDLDDADARDWLRALVWPEHGARLKRLESAIASARGEKPRIVAGDALERLPEALADAPADETLCVYHTIVTYQFTHEMRKALDDTLVAASLRRPVWRIAFEWAGDHRYPLTLTRYADGDRREKTLALCDPHGAWIEWMD